MSTAARRIRSVPFRTATATWDLVVDLACAGDDSMRATFNEAANVGSMLIAEEHTRTSPVLVSGCGPQARFYTLHGRDAIDGTNMNESPLQLRSSSDWSISLPASGIDFEIASNALAGLNRISVYDPTASVTGDSTATSGSATSTQAAKRITVDLSALE